MGTEEKVKTEEGFIREIEKCMGGEKMVSLPLTLRVEDDDDMPDIERWKNA